MAFVGETAGAAKGREEEEAIKRAGKNVQNDKRDLADLWNAALKAYKNVVGDELTPRAADAKGLIAIGVDEMNKFHRFRHDGGKVDKLRSLFSTNLDLLEEGSKQLVAAATPAFPPAAAIGTAMTWVLSTCRQVSADYDVVEVFFNDMNSFLRRVAILEKRLPKDKGYQNCLMEVFASFLRMCGFAIEYIKLGRFAKWIKNLLRPDDGELGQAREDMNLKVQNLDQATRFAILRDVVETRKMGEELNQNMKEHKQMLEDHRSTLHALEVGQKAMQANITKLLKAFESTQKDVLINGPTKGTDRTARQNKPASASRIRGTLPAVDGDVVEYHTLKETIVDGTCTWLFSQPEWLAWVGEGIEGPPAGSPRLLAITGDAGSGKSHIAATVYDHLEQQAGDSEQYLCAAHFYFREQNPHLAVFRNAVITVVNQVAEQNPTLCERIYTQLVRDDVFVTFGDWRSLLRDLLQPCFEAEARYRLYLLLDSIDELDDFERAELMEFWRIIVTADLRISLVVTCRPELLDWVRLTFGDDPTSSFGIRTIQVTRELQKSDIAAIMRNQLGNLGSLKRFSPYVKQQISETIEATAPNPLYAHHLLRYFDSIGREGAVLGQLKSLPQTLYELYEVLLTKCMRRTVDRHHDAVGVLFCWLAFSFRPLVLDEVVSLLRHVSGDDTLELDDIPEPMMLFVRVGDPGRGSELVHTSEIGYLLTGDVGDRVYEDGRLPVQFRKRAMRSFFSEAASIAKSDASRRLLISPSEAHRRIFLAASDMTRLTPKASATPLHLGLTYYAAFYLVFHWMGIDYRQHSLKERAEIMETLASVMSNKHGYSKMAQTVNINYERSFGDDVLERMGFWASEMTGENGVQLSDDLTPDARSWWKRVAHEPASGLMELAKGHVRDVYQAPSTWEAEGAYNCAIASLLRSGHGKRVAEQAALNFSPLAGEAHDRPAVTNQDGILGLAGLFDDVPLTTNAYLSIAWVLLMKGHSGPARLTCEQGLACEPDEVETFRFLWLAVQAELYMDRPQESVRIISERLNQLDIQNVPEPFQRWAHIIRARVYAKLGDRTVAAAAFSEGRALDKGTSMGDILNEEATIYIDANDYAGLVDVLRSWSPIERSAWLTSDRPDSTRHPDLRKAAARTGQRDYLVEIYEEAIEQLDKFGAAAALRCDLATAHLLVRDNTGDARRVLDVVLDDHSDGQVHMFTYDDPRIVLVRAISLQSRALWDLFVLSRDPAVKAALLEVAHGLMKRPLASCVSSFSTTDTLYHEIMVARMTLQMGPRVDFQMRIQRVIGTCFDTLEDNVCWNDGRSLWLLSQALTHLGKAVSGTRLRRAACILLSAQFNALEPSANTKDGHSPVKDVQRDGGGESGSVEPHVDASRDGSGPPSDNTSSDHAQEPETKRTEIINDCEAGCAHDQVGGPSDVPGLHGDEGDLAGTPVSCDGTTCHPRARFTEWKGRSLHVCIDCDNTALCEQCYAALQADHDGTAPFCGRGHDHIKAPVEGWRGVKNGIMRIEGEEDVPFKKFLYSVRELCDEAWDQFWQS